MEEEIGYFFDTYSVIEIIEGNQSLIKYFGEKVSITIFNLAEIYWVVLNRLGETEADIIYNQYRNSVVDIDDNTLKEAIKFRKEHKKKNLSYADCVGYIYAKLHKMKFLTGDKEFEGFPNVEFVR